MQKKNEHLDMTKYVKYVNNNDNNNNQQKK